MLKFRPIRTRRPSTRAPKSAAPCIQRQQSSGSNSSGRRRHCTFSNAMDSSAIRRRLTSKRRTRMRPVGLCFFMVLLSMPIHATTAYAADGREIAANGNGNNAPACSVCHGAQGAGQPDAGYPRLAGLDSEYLLEQISEFADGSRDNETMAPIAKALSPDERQSVAKFYAGLVAPKMEEPQKADDKTIAAGGALAGRGDWSNGLQGCGQCHRA